ncbi:MAG TPA: metallophosphoesterase [Bryobacteraceae bacterium]|jgi:UDP-2,3-diacylglucosamine pyrophosphatase LpxH|nr:metallophosphoesterase [Bryobacteraceae bacterium]
MPTRLIRPLCKTLNLSLLLCCAIAIWASARSHDFRFVILGDRTGSAVPGVYQEVWREAALDHPDFVINVGDTIEGGNDLTTDSQWKSVLQDLAPFRRFRIFYTPGNHDVWSLASAQAYEKFTGHPLHYSFDYQNAHFTVLDNSRSDQLPSEELAYLQKDLQAHAKQPIKFVFMHRPSWIVPVLFQNPDFPLQSLAKRWGVEYVVAGHLHQMLHFDLGGVTYLSMGSSGGHLRDKKEYEKGWFFQHTLVTIRGKTAIFSIKEIGPPFGRSRITDLGDWGVAGLVTGSHASQ